MGRERISSQAEEVKMTKEDYIASYTDAKMMYDSNSWREAYSDEDDDWRYFRNGAIESEVTMKDLKTRFAKEYPNEDLDQLSRDYMKNIDEQLPEEMHDADYLHDDEMNYFYDTQDALQSLADMRGLNRDDYNGYDYDHDEMSYD